jgi:hypothetical protein
MSGFIIAIHDRRFLRSGALLFNLNRTVAAVFIFPRVVQHFSLPSFANSSAARQATHKAASVVIDAIIDDQGDVSEGFRCVPSLEVRAHSPQRSARTRVAECHRHIQDIELINN